MPIIPPANGLQIKVRLVLENLGNFLPNEHKNFGEKKAKKLKVKVFGC